MKILVIGSKQQCEKSRQRMSRDSKIEVTTASSLDELVALLQPHYDMIEQDFFASLDGKIS